MSLKTVADLKGNVASVGGAMGSWPFRTLWFVSRWERTGQTDPAVVKSLQAQNIDALKDLSRLAYQEYGIDTSTLDARIHALELASVADMRIALNQAYNGEYSEFEQCPYEKEGRDMSCQRCTVAAKALEWIMEQYHY